jgi:hypothetical protein
MLVVNMGGKKRRNQTSKRSPSKAPEARTDQPPHPVPENSIPASSTAFTPVNSQGRSSDWVPQPYLPRTTPYSPAEWNPSPVNPSPSPVNSNPLSLHPNWNSPLTKGGFGDTTLKNTLIAAGGTESRSNPGRNSVWTCDANVKSLTDAYNKIGLNMQQGNELTFEVLFVHLSN